MARIDYLNEFAALLGPYRSAGSSISAADLFAHPQLGAASSQTKRKHLKTFLDGDMSYFGTVQGILPSVDSLIDLAAQRVGAPVSEANVVQANKICADIVKRATDPVVEEVVRGGLASFISSNALQIPIQDLMDFLIGEFAAFTKGAGNGLVSVAGSINEKLLVRCLLERGLTENDFRQTGTESEGDIVIHSKAANRSNLGIEVKSYHARERLLRGLKDVDRPKVGAGYFVDYSEFNAQRTRLLLQTNAGAIYIPSDTLAKIDPASLAMTTNDTIAFGSRFYRPLERFASDMAYFVENGELPQF